jgi:hypothetical protein
VAVTIDRDAGAAVKKIFLWTRIAFQSVFDGRAGIDATLPSRQSLTTRAPSEECPAFNESRARTCDGDTES